jgi:hypothetical protein
MFADFFGVCFDQIYNHLAKNTYMSGGAVKLPVVLMTAISSLHHSIQAALRQLCIPSVCHHQAIDTKVMLPDWYLYVEVVVMGVCCYENSRCRYMGTVVGNQHPD